MPRKGVRSIEYLAELLASRIENNFDSVVIVDSGSVKGTGKSTFTILSQKAIVGISAQPWSIKDFMIFNPSQEKIVERVKTLPDKAAISIDEGVLVAYKRDYGKDSQKELVKFINICRKFKKILIINFPDFWDLDKDIRNLADFRITILKRGQAVVRGKVGNPEVPDKWIRVKSTDIIESYTKNDPTNIDLVIASLRRCPNYLFDITFPELPKWEYSEYEELSKIEEIKRFEFNPRDKWRIRCCILSFILKNDLKQGDLYLSKKFREHLYNHLKAQGYSGVEINKLNLGISRQAIPSWANSIISAPDGAPTEEYNNNKNITALYSDGPALD